MRFKARVRFFSSWDFSAWGEGLQPEQDETSAPQVLGSAPEGHFSSISEDSLFGRNYGKSRQVKAGAAETRSNKIYPFGAVIASKKFGVTLWEHAIRDEGDYERHVDYIHCNPEARSRDEGCGLALFKLPPLRSQWYL
jgi:hypothetical protein